jgi:hypothetical protein
MKRILALLIILVLSTPGMTQKIAERDRKEILKTLEEQRIAWNEGYLSGYMNGYWQSDSLQFITKNGVTKGWKETLARYMKAYPTKEEMGNLTFEVISLEKLNKSSAFMIGNWNLQMKESIVSGCFSLIWKKIDKKWLVVVDHSS